jgi:hypothetical protein
MRKLLALPILMIGALATPMAGAANLLIANGPPLVSIVDGDYVHPAFSPDGSMLAYARVVAGGDGELVEVFVRRLKGGRTIRLLDAETSKRYAVYSSFVTELRWPSPNRLAATISDGDVDATTVTYDVTTQAVLEEVASSFDEEIDATTSRAQGHLKALRSLPSELPPEALQQALESAVLLDDGSFVLQPQYAGVDQHLWRLAPSGGLTLLKRMPPGRGPELRGALRFGNDLILVLASEREIEVLRYRDGTTTSLSSFPSTGAAEMTVLDANLQRALFYVRTGHSYERTPGALLVYDRRGLQQVNDYPNLYDVAADGRRQRICFAVWEGGQRHLKVHRLAGPDATR